MRILTVRQPWAWAIVHGGKDVENRVRNIAGSYRGPVAIHVGLADDDAAFYDPRIDFALDACMVRSDELAHGVILGVVDLVGVHPSNDEQCERFSFFGGVNGACSGWAELGAWHLEFANPRMLAMPIQYRGALGLRELPEDVAATVRGLL